MSEGEHVNIHLYYNYFLTDVLYLVQLLYLDYINDMFYILYLDTYAYVYVCILCLDLWDFK